MKLAEEYAKEDKDVAATISLLALEIAKLHVTIACVAVTGFGHLVQRELVHGSD